MNESFNDNYTKIKIDYFSVTSQYHCVTFDDLYLLSRDNYDVEEFMIPNDFIPTTHSGYISLEVQEGFKYGFNFSVCNILNNVGYLMTRNQYDIKGSR